MTDSKQTPDQSDKKDTDKAPAPAKAANDTTSKAAGADPAKTNGNGAAKADPKAAAKDDKDDKSAPMKSGSATVTVGTGKDAEKKDEGKDDKKDAPKPTASAKPTASVGKPETGAAAASSSQASKSAPASRPTVGSDKPTMPAKSMAESTAPRAASGGEQSSGGGTSLVTLLIAAVIGGIVVAVLVSGMSGSNQDSALLGRISALEARLDQAELGTTNPEIASGIRQEIENIKQRVTEVEALRRQVSRLSDSSLQPRTALSSGGTSALEGGMTELNDAIQRLETRMSQFSGEVTRNEARLQNRVGQLEALTPANLPDLLEGKADSDVVLDLRTRLASLEENDIARSAYSAAQAVALANLSRASRDTGSFLPEFNAVSRVVPDQEELLASVREYAAQGLPSLGMLRNRFDDTARDIVRAHRAESGSNFLTRLFANLMASITVRPTGRVEGNSVNAILARAEGNLENDNLQGAVSELRNLSGDAAVAAGPWLEQARARVQLDTLLRDLNARVIVGISEEAGQNLTPAPAVTPAPITIDVTPEPTEEDLRAVDELNGAPAGDEAAAQSEGETSSAPAPQGNEAPAPQNESTGEQSAAPTPPAAGEQQSAPAEPSGQTPAPEQTTAPQPEADAAPAPPSAGEATDEAPAASDAAAEGEASEAATDEAAGEGEEAANDGEAADDGAAAGEGEGEGESDNTEDGNV